MADGKVTKRVEVTVRDTRGKPYRFTLVEGGVKVEPPASWKTAPIPLADLRRALKELEAEADDRDGDGSEAGPAAAG